MKRQAGKGRLNNSDMLPTNAGRRQNYLAWLPASLFLNQLLHPSITFLSNMDQLAPCITELLREWREGKKTATAETNLNLWSYLLRVGMLTQGTLGHLQKCSCHFVFMIYTAKK